MGTMYTAILTITKLIRYCLFIVVCGTVRPDYVRKQAVSEKHHICTIVLVYCTTRALVHSDLPIDILNVIDSFSCTISIKHQKKTKILLQYSLVMN